MSERQAIRRGIVGGWVAVVPWFVAAIGWTAHWNAYINLALTLGGTVVMWTCIAVTLDRYAKGERAG